MLRVLAIYTLLCQLTGSQAFSLAARSSAASFVGNFNYDYAANQNVIFATKYASASHHGTRRKNRSQVSALSVGAEGDEDFPVEPTSSEEEVGKTSSSSSTPPFPLVIWRFTRPHTIIGSAIAIPSIFLLAAPTYQSFFTLRSFSSLLYAAIPSLFMNLYITGLNQITDVEIDKINVSSSHNIISISIDFCYLFYKHVI
jgi:hypothetical protein